MLVLDGILTIRLLEVSKNFFFFFLVILFFSISLHRLLILILARILFYLRSLVVGVAQDVTEATKHDRAVATAARELRQLVNTANTPIFGVDRDGNINEWNDKTAEITGYSREEAIAQPLTALMDQGIKTIMDKALHGEESCNHEIEFQNRANQKRHIIVNATSRRDENANIVGVLGVGQDVTEVIKHDTEVAAMANELRQLVNTANAPIFGIDVKGNVNEWNDKTVEITGFSKEEAMGKHLGTYFDILYQRL